MRLVLTPGQAGDTPFAAQLLTDLRMGTTLLADRAYDTDAIRERAEAVSAWANFPPRSIRKDSFPFSPQVYRQRDRVERFFNRIKSFRGLATRYDKTDANHFAGLTLAAYVRRDEDTAEQIEPDTRKSNGRSDPAVASIVAVGRAAAPEEKRKAREIMFV